MDIKRLFTEHPASVGETYFEHLCAAASFAGRMIAGGIACFLHALLPFAFTHTGGDCIQDLHEEMLSRRSPATRLPPGADAAVR